MQAFNGKKRAKFTSLDPSLTHPSVFSVLSSSDLANRPTPQCSLRRTVHPPLTFLCPRRDRQGICPTPACVKPGALRACRLTTALWGLRRGQPLRFKRPTSAARALSLANTCCANNAPSCVTQRTRSCQQGFKNSTAIVRFSSRTIVPVLLLRALDRIRLFLTRV